MSLRRADGAGAPYARQKLVQCEGLGHVVVGPELQREDFVDLLVLGGQHDDRYRTGLADLFARFHAVKHRQHDVEHDEVGLFALCAMATAVRPSPAVATW